MNKPTSVALVSLCTLAVLVAGCDADVPDSAAPSTSGSPQAQRGPDGAAVTFRHRPVAAAEPTGPAPVPIAPEDGATLREARPLFRWNPLASEESVAIEICADPACAQVTVSFHALAGLEARPPQDLAPGAYAWRVARTDGFQRTSAWSGARALAILAADPPPSPPPIDAPDLLSVWSVARQDVWAVGAAGTILHFDGHWTAAASPTTATLRAVWATAGGEAWAVGDAGTILRGDASGWHVVTSPTDRTLRGVWGVAGGEAWAVGDGGLILRWDGASWQVALDGAGGHSRYDARLLGVWGRAADDVWAVGSGHEPDDDYAALLLHWDGSAWSESYLCNPEGTRFASGGWNAVLTDVFGLADGSLWAAGGCGPGAAQLTIGYLADNRGGAGWGDSAGAADYYDYRALDSVWASSAGDVWAASSNVSSASRAPTILHFDGSAWSESTDLATVGVNDLAGSAADDVWAVGAGGKRLHWDGTGWTNVP
jgi:hypothetical protein